MTEPDKTSPPPRKGPLLVVGALAAAALAAWIFSLLIPLPGLAESLHLAKGSDGLWTLIGAGLFFPILFGVALLRMAAGVDRKPLLLAYGGGIYLVGCLAESHVRGQLALWPQLLVAGCACGVLFALLPGALPDNEDEAPDEPDEPKDDR